MSARLSRTAVLAAYTEHGSVMGTADALGSDHQKVAAVLARAGVATAGCYLTSDQQVRLRGDYPVYRTIRSVPALADALGLPGTLLRAQIVTLGLDERAADIQWAKASESALRALLEHFAGTSLALGQYGAKFGVNTATMRAELSRRWPDEWEKAMAAKVRKARGAAIGRDTENRLRDRLVSDGWVIARSAGSRGPFDIAAMRAGVVLLIQVKRSGHLPPEGWNLLIDTAATAGAIPVMAENPYPGCWRVWRLTGPKSGRGPEPKVLLDLAEPLAVTA